MTWRFHRYPDILGQETCFGYSNFYPLVVSDSKTMASCAVTLAFVHTEEWPHAAATGTPWTEIFSVHYNLLVPLIEKPTGKFLSAGEWTRGDRSRAQLFINAVHFYLKSTMTFLNNHIFLFTSATRKLKAKFATQI